MELECDVCHKTEKIDLYANDIIHFACGYERKQTTEDLNILFSKYRGKG